MFELNSAPQVYFEVVFELLQCREYSSQVLNYPHSIGKKLANKSSDLYSLRLESAKIHRTVYCFS